MKGYKTTRKDVQFKKKNSKVTKSNTGETSQNITMDPTGSENIYFIRIHIRTYRPVTNLALSYCYKLKNILTLFK